MELMVSYGIRYFKKNIPHLNYNNARFPILGAAVQKRAGNARHDSTVWGFARAADSLGVDILQNCEVTGVKGSQNNIESIETSRGDN
jgi:sarcosine oxidase subunit beta